MVLPRREGFGDGDADDGSDRPNRREADGSGSSDHVGRSRSIAGGLTERLRGVLRDEASGDLVLEQSDLENGVLRWLRVLDQQVIGACRADERLVPLLKLNVSSGAAEGLLVAQMSQYFEASEVGMLARCLCIPLVSIRVGKVDKQGTVLCPTTIRGHLNLTLMPSSNMHISFAGDNGCTERLAVVSIDPESSAVMIEEISADSSGRSFLLRLPGSRVSYFWCSEKSKLHGTELLLKMKDLVRKKPTLSHLTGICESRLDSFAAHLRAYLGTPSSQGATSTASSSTVGSGLHTGDPGLHSPSKYSRARLTAAHSAKVYPFYQGSLGARSNTFKDGMLRSSLSSRGGSREKHKRRGDNYSSLLTVNDLPVTSVSSSCTTSSLFTGQCESQNSAICCLPEIPLSSFSPPQVNLYPSQVTSFSPPISPYYCWCPPFPFPSHLPVISSASLPLPSLLSSTELLPLSVVPSKHIGEIPSLSFPPHFPETVVCFPHPVSSQQIPTFTPFMSDPIVHIPIVDVCSAGQGYLVSAGPGMSSAIAPLIPSRSSPLIPETESVLEKSARETLRMLMASAPMASTSPQLLNMLPSVFNHSQKNFPCPIANLAGSRCLYTGTLDVKALATGVSLMGLSEKIAHCDSSTRGNPEEEQQGDLERPQVSSCANKDDLFLG